MRKWTRILLRSLKLREAWLPKDIQAIEDAILAKLLRLYFNDDLEISPRLVEVSVKCTIMCFARTRLTTHVLCRLNHLFTSNTIYRIIYL
jgi:hypothetical protein